MGWGLECLNVYLGLKDEPDLVDHFEPVLVCHLGLDLVHDIGLVEDQEHLLCEGLLGLCISPCPPLHAQLPTLSSFLKSSYLHIFIYVNFAHTHIFDLPYFFS